MIRRMSRHASRPDSRVYQIQARVPADVFERLRGTYVTVECPPMHADPGCSITLKLGSKVKGSLHTRDCVVATARRVRVLERLERLYASVRTETGTLTHRQMIGLAGEVYALLRANFDEDPGSSEAWEAWKGFVRAAREGRIPTAPAITPGELADEREEAAHLFGPDLTQGIDALPPSGDRAALEDRCGRLVWWVLSRHGLHVDRPTRLWLLEHVAEACIDAGWALKNAARGDYSPDRKAARFPTFEPKASAVTLTQIFERWRKETQPAASTVVTWRGVVSSLKDHLGHEDATRITAHDIVAFKDRRLATPSAKTGKPPSAKTLNDSDLTCIRRLFSFAMENRLLASNPATGIKVASRQKAGEGRLPYSDDEIAQLLAYAEQEALPYRHWIPLLLVTSGARVAEIAQLWGNRVRTQDGIAVMVLEPAADGGSLKNPGAERTVPVHPAVIRAGFLEFVRARGQGPLFYGRNSRHEGSQHASKATANHLGEWIRTLPGFTDPRKAPSHSIRHWWKSACAKVGMQDSIADHIQGHAVSSVAGRYRHFELKTLATAVASISVPEQISGPTQTRGREDGVMPVAVYNPRIQAKKDCSTRPRARKRPRPQQIAVDPLRAVTG